MSAADALPDSPASPVKPPSALPVWVPPLLPLVSGVLFAVALPPYRLSWLGWVALVPLLWTAVRLPRTLWAAGAGLATGLVAGVVQLGWDGISGATGFSRNYALAPFIWLSFVLAVASAWAQWQRQKGSRGLGWVLGVAAAGTVAEWLTGFTPLPVGIALGQAENLPLIQWCVLTGIWGVSFLMYLVSAAFADALSGKLSHWRNWRLLAVAVALYGFLKLGGMLGLVGWFQREFAAKHSTPSQRVSAAHRWLIGEHLEVAAVQDYGGPETATGDPRQAHLASVASPSTLAPPDAADLMKQAARSGAKFIVGTENSFGAAFRPDNPRDPLRIIARDGKTHLVVGHEMADARTPGANPFNCATLVGPEGAVGTHHKIHLFLGERQTMQAGDRATVAPAPWGKTGLLICFDTCYTGPTRQAVQEGAVIVAVPNYDPPTPGAILHHLHAALMAFRAVENGVAYVRADPNGLSQIVQPWGEVVAVGPMYQSTVLRANVRLGDGQGTFFTRWGDWLPVGCLLAIALNRLWNMWRKAIAPSKGNNAVSGLLPRSFTTGAIDRTRGNHRDIVVQRHKKENARGASSAAGISPCLVLLTAITAPAAPALDARPVLLRSASGCTRLPVRQKRTRTRQWRRGH